MLRTFPRFGLLMDIPPPDEPSQVRIERRQDESQETGPTRALDEEGEDVRGHEDLGEVSSWIQDFQISVVGYVARERAWADEE